jgi:hypothetical protein
LKDLEFTDNRLTLLLRRLSKPETWQTIETDLRRSILLLLELKPGLVRLNVTTDHQIRRQFG